MAQEQIQEQRQEQKLQQSISSQQFLQAQLVELPITQLMERIETRHGHRQTSYMKEMGMGNDRYILIDLDNGEVRMTQAQAVEGLKPFVAE